MSWATCLAMYAGTGYLEGAAPSGVSEGVGAPKHPSKCVALGVSTEDESIKELWSLAHQCSHCLTKGIDVTVTGGQPKSDKDRPYKAVAIPIHI